MKSYDQYATVLTALLDRLEWGHGLPSERSEVLHHLNGGAAAALRDLVPAVEVHKSGAFFTPEALARILVGNSARAADASVLDPSMGAGDLLLRWAESLPVHRSLETTLDLWGSLLCGFELHREFISVAKRRLVLLAICRGAKLSGERPPKWRSLFPMLRQLDFINFQQAIPKGCTIVMNPPFTMIPSLPGCAWSRGQVNAAAVFVERVLASVPQDHRIIAILPEVLRSGTRYSRWRQIVAGKFAITRCVSWGRFSDHADVDVFVLDGITRTAGDRVKSQFSERLSRRLRLGSMASISVGPVVPHRHREEGRSMRYITARSMPAWGTVRDITDRRRFSGTFFTPPFVVVRRTSSPHDRIRAIGTMVIGKHPVAVENHLLVIRPATGTVSDCRRILDSLRKPSSTAWLNDRIRCRHLTVSALREIPLFES